jgi:hypothetical protein
MKNVKNKIPVPLSLSLTPSQTFCQASSEEGISKTFEENGKGMKGQWKEIKGNIRK